MEFLDGRKPSGKTSKGVPFWYLNVDTIDDSIDGKWWHRVHTVNFGWEQQLHLRKHLKVFDGDVLIHKKILEGDKIPSKNYFIIMDGEPLQQSNPDVKEEMVKKLLAFIDTYQKYPFACEFAKSFKNGKVQINYSPTEYDNFALKVSPKMCTYFDNIPNEDIDEYFEKLPNVLKNPLESKKTKSKKTMFSDFR
jgi:hypothetical protein